MANDDIVIEVESFLRSRAESREDPDNQRPSICKVPSILRDLSPDSFKPQFVSIGPLHKEDPNVQDIERLKMSYLHDLLNRSTSPSNKWKTKFEACLQKVKDSIAKIKSSYCATKYSDDELANMMVMDGGFILEFCLKVFYHEPSLLSKIQTARIAIDLMLLENQIPFFVLEDIFDLTKPNSISLSLTSLLHKVLLKFVHPFLISTYRNFPDDFSFPDVLNNSNHEHVLNCLHKIYKFESSEIVYAPTVLNFHHSAVELNRFGVNFKPQKEIDKAMTMKFVKASSFFLWTWRKPATLVMPTLIIQDYSEVVLRNFIAYEQFFPQANYFFTSYSCVMDKLINDKADVSNLVGSRVLVNRLGSNEEAAKMINSICKNIEVEQFCYTKEIQALDEYCNSYWPKYIAFLRRTFFNDPMDILNLEMGIFVFVFTAIQTYLAVLSFDKSSKG